MLQPARRARHHRDNDLRAKSGTRGAGKRNQQTVTAHQSDVLELIGATAATSSASDKSSSTSNEWAAGGFDLWQPDDMNMTDDVLLNHTSAALPFVSRTEPVAAQPVLNHAAEVAATTALPLLSHSPLPRIFDDQSTAPQLKLSKGPWLACEHTPPVSLHPADFVATIAAAETAAQAAAATSVTLTSHIAHTAPKATESEKRMTRQARRLLEQAEAELRTAQEQAAAPGDTAQPANVDLADVDAQGSDSDTESDSSEHDVPMEYKDNNNLVRDIDDPDPFLVPPPDDNSTAFTQLHDVILAICTVVTWLNVVHHVARVPCDVLMRFLSWILLRLGRPDLAHMCPTTVKTAARRLGIDVNVHNLPVCPSCKEVYPSQNAPADCVLCGTALWRTTKSKIPAIKYPYSPLQEHLERVLVQPGMEDMLDSWRTVPRDPNKLVDIFDGRVTQELVGPDGQRFFRNGEGDAHGPDGELRIGLMWGIDWCVDVALWG